MTRLHIPDVGDLDALAAALAYASGNWYQGPVKRGTKHPGSVLGGSWHHQTSRDPGQLAAWLAGTDHGIFLHAGRSGAVIADIDHPDKVPPILARAIGELRPPFQSTRPGEPGRGHAIFACPPGRVFGNSTGRLGKGWGEIRGANGVIIVAPSVHRDGGCYRWIQTGPVPELPPEIADMLDDAQASVDAATDEAVAAFKAEHTGNARPRLLAATVRRFRSKTADGESRHESAVASTVWAAKEARAGYYPATAAFTAIGEAFRQSLNGENFRNPASEYAGILAWAVGQANAADLDEVRRIAERNDARPFTGSPLAGLAAFITQLRAWLDLPDPAHVLLTLAAAVTRDLDGEPVWLLLVAVPSSGKTETVRLLDKRADGRLNEVTAAGLLGWTKGKESKPSGVLARIGDRGLVTFGDLSSLLATSDTGGRDAAFGILRRAYDGYVTRDISPPGRPAPGAAEQLSWAGRLTVVAAVTGAIDRYAVHADQLGPRWVYTRIAEPTTEAKQRATARARRGGLDAHRDTARKTAETLIAAAAARVPDDVPDDVFTVIADAALVTCWGRAAVPRHGYGRREIDGIPVVESPPRVVRQLHALARGLLALGLPDGYAAALARRVALDSMPEDRRAVLAALSGGEILTTSKLAAEAGLHRHVARMRAEELEVIGVLRGIRPGADLDEEFDRRPVSWCLNGDDGQVIADVFKRHAADVGWHEIWVTHSSTPQEQDEDDQETDERYPDFVPPPAEPRDTPGCLDPACGKPPRRGCSTCWDHAWMEATR
jgi:hypothetical protein